MVRSPLTCRAALGILSTFLGQLHLSRLISMLPVCDMNQFYRSHVLVMYKFFFVGNDHHCPIVICTR